MFTPRTTYIFPVRPILVYDQQIYSSASVSNLWKMDHTQQSAGRIITSLHHSCPGGIFLFWADLLPFREKRDLGLLKYFSKLLNYSA